MAFARTAILIAIPHIKKTWDYNLYLRSIGQINETLGRPDRAARLRLNENDQADGGDDEEDEPMSDSIGDLIGEEAEGVPDRAWVDRVREEEKREVTKTDVELRGYESNLIKESIRVSLKSGFIACAVWASLIMPPAHTLVIRSYGCAKWKVHRGHQTQCRSSGVCE